MMKGDSSFLLPTSHFPADGGNKTDVSIFGQESNPTTWRLAHMNLAIHVIRA